MVAAHHTCLTEPAPAFAPTDEGEHYSSRQGGMAVLDQLRTTRSERTRWRFFEIHALQVQGMSAPMIGRRLGFNIKTVRRYLRT